ncbi:unnamed protein product [Linum tenue]|uniref:Protein kinase domain-containing protein n=1 Tax=Linum tenue TaxID=586396 RepID=A0AAV0P1V1_9ROSI|nr:unnamed protein product [Linum tenue]
MCETLKNKYQVCEEIGRGRFGVISRCFSPTKNSFFACKTIDKSLLADQADRDCLEKEPKIMLFLPPHPNILQIHDAFDSDDSLTLILDLCEPYTLYDKVIKSNGGLPEPKSAGIMRQLLEAVAHCHRFGVVHRDIKPDNVLMLSGIPPFYGETVEEIFEAVIRGNLRFPPKVFRNVSSQAKDFLRKLISRDPSRRFSAEQALRKFLGFFRFFFF